MSWRKRAINSPKWSTFADRGEALARSSLAAIVIGTMRQRQLNQHLAAIIMGLDQPKVSHLVTGRIDSFSIERLIRFLTALGHDVEIVVRPRVPKRRHGKLRVDLSS